MGTPFTRRTFLGAAGTSLLVLPASSGRAAASDRVRVAVIGLRSRGSDHAKLFASDPGAEVVAVCDVDDAMFAKPVKAVESAAGKAPRTEKDFRRLLDDKTIDAVTIATPDHWHGLMTVMACQAGKDVYVEKPASHNVVEGRRMVEAARKYRRVVQLGTQRRSAPSSAEAIERVQGGAIGKVGMASPARSPPASIMPCGKDPPLTAPSTRIAFITTGTGSGTGGPASWGTTASTASMSRAGGWASMPRWPSAQAGASTSSTTIKR